MRKGLREAGQAGAIFCGISKAETRCLESKVSVDEAW